MNPYKPDAELSPKQCAFQELCSGLRFLEFDSGWLPLLEDLHENLVVIDPDYKILQIKEKFGGLRYYAQCTKPCSEQFFALIHDAESQSYKICETCGAKTGRLARSERGWVKTVCDQHRIEQNRTWIDEKE